MKLGWTITKPNQEKSSLYVIAQFSVYKISKHFILVRVSMDLESIPGTLWIHPGWDASPFQVTRSHIHSHQGSQFTYWLVFEQKRQNLEEIQMDAGRTCESSHSAPQ